MTEKEKMNAGLWYDANNDQELIDQRFICQDLCFELNQLKPSDEKRNEVISKRSCFIKSFYSGLWKKYKVRKECFCEH